MSSLFLHVLFLLLMGSKISTALQADCSCNNYVNPNGFGKCKKLFPQLNNQFSCFVNEPTTCSDVYSINSEPIHRNVSAQACREAQASDLDTSGFLTNADFDTAKEERFNTPVTASAIPFDPDLFEGDIVDDDFGDTINVAERKWPKSNDGKVYIPISFPATASTDEKAAIARTILEFENKTCVRLRKYNETTDFNYVHINTRGFGCQSPVGRKGGRQTIRARDCFSEEGGWGHLCHEMMHSLGFYHEHTRSDRDDHVEVLWEEIERVKGEDNLFRIEKNFKKCRNCTTYGVYDIASLMHYPSLLGFQNRTVIRPKSELYSLDEINKMGQRDGLSPLDVEDIQKYFECDLSFSQHEEQCDIKLSKKEHELHELCQYVDCTNQRARELCGEVCTKSASGKEGVDATLECTGGSIDVVDGYVFCNGNEHDHPLYTTRISAACDGLEACKIGYNGGGYTCLDCINIRVSDPCPGVNKDFNVEYVCASKDHRPKYKYVGKGSCWNDQGRHPPYEFGTSANSKPETCYEDCMKMAASQGKRCTGFDIRPKCVYYFDEEIPRSKVASFPGAPACFKVSGTTSGATASATTKKALTTAATSTQAGTTVQPTTHAEYSYKKREKKYCNGNYGGFYNNSIYESAISSCSKDLQCRGVTNDNCGGKIFRLCLMKYSDLDSPEYGSCTYTKEQGYPFSGKSWGAKRFDTVTTNTWEKCEEKCCKTNDGNEKCMFWNYYVKGSNANSCHLIKFKDVKKVYLNPDTICGKNTDWIGRSYNVDYFN